MLAAAPAAADARLLAHDLGDQALDVSRTCQEMSVAAMIREDDVAVDQRLRHGDARPLLADAGVDRPEELPLGEEAEQPLLDAANEHCPGEEVGATPLCAVEAREGLSAFESPI